MENFIDITEYTPILMVVFMFFLHNKFFITPEMLERRHRDIIKEVETRFASLVSVNELKQQFGEVKLKIDKIYEHFMKQMD